MENCPSEHKKYQILFTFGLMVAWCKMPLHNDVGEHVRLSKLEVVLVHGIVLRGRM